MPIISKQHARHEVVGHGFTAVAHKPGNTIILAHPRPGYFECRDPEPMEEFHLVPEMMGLAAGAVAERLASHSDAWITTMLQRDWRAVLDTEYAGQDKRLLEVFEMAGEIPWQSVAYGFKRLLPAMRQFNDTFPLEEVRLMMQACPVGECFDLTLEFAEAA